MFVAPSVSTVFVVPSAFFVLEMTLHSDKAEFLIIRSSRILHHFQTAASVHKIPQKSAELPRLPAGPKDISWS